MQHKASFTNIQQDAINDAAAKILAHPSFRSSERSTRLFRYLVDRALSDEGELLKERRIGHEVFGREIGYDTAADPIVRNAASETRKRLRQYEAERGADEPVHIQLAPGAYVLDFRFTEPESTPGKSVEAGTSNPIPELQPVQNQKQVAPPEPLHPWRSLRVAYGIALIATLCCVGFAVAFFHQRDAVKQARQAATDVSPLWAPIFNSGKEVFITLGHADRMEADDSAAQLASGALQRITVTDLKAYTNISGFLQLNGKPFQMRTDNQTTLLDLRDRPAVLIGNHNNDWALRLTGNLRYRFDFDEAHLGKPGRVFSIYDSQQANRAWRVSVSTSQGSYDDYAIAGRVLDPVTGGLLIYVAGAAAVGTQAASEFVTQPQFFRNFPANLDNPKTNIEVVLKTPVVAGVAGSPEVVATYMW